jgi:uncharacterized cupin superfamily protein
LSSNTTSPSLVHLTATTAVLPEPVAKPTSLDGQVESTLVAWESADASADVGVWECGPGRFTSVRDGFTEICQILSGRATIEGEDGVSAELEAGSAIVLPSGWRGTWTIHETVRKTYVVVHDRPRGG